MVYVRKQDYAVRHRKVCQLILFLTLCFQSLLINIASLQNHSTIKASQQLRIAAHFTAETTHAYLRAVVPVTFPLPFM